MPDDLSLAAKLQAAAAATVGSLTETHYTHATAIDAAAGLFDTDCSGYLAFLLGVVAPRHGAAIPASGRDGRLLARDFYDFAAALPVTVANGWRRLAQPAEAVAGDLLCWRIVDPDTGDTGHVMVLTAGPTAIPEGLAVPVSDASSVQHFDDSRGEGPGQFPDGVGTGTVHLRLDAAGAADAFRFGPRATRWIPAPIALMRIEPFSAG